jgi:hypothetical protein
MVEDCNRLIVIHHAQVIGQIVGPRNSDTGDSLQVQCIELFLKLNMAMGASLKGESLRGRSLRYINWKPISLGSREISMYEFGQGSAAPFNGSPSQEFVRKIAKFDHKEKTSNEINRIVMLFVICGSQKI